MLDDLLALLDDNRVHAAAILIGSIVAAFLIQKVVIRVLAHLAGRTQTTLDDLIVRVLERPIFYSVIFAGVAYALHHLEVSAGVHNLTISLLKTFAVVVWTMALFRIGAALLRTISYHARPTSVIQARTLPFFDILVKLLIAASATYLVMLAWHVDITAWLASAGIVGIAVGFAAKDSLANLFAGIFIIADAPYKLGDFIQFEDGLRGRVTDIGIRSTRILTRDDIEINIPNSIIGNAKIVNETGGPYAKERVPVPISVAYGSDVDRVREVLMSTTHGVPHVAEDPKPLIFFNSFGASGLEFAVLIWIEDPALREIVVSDMNFRIYKALAAAKIEIPYSKHDVYIKAFPGLAAEAPSPAPNPAPTTTPTSTPPTQPIEPDPFARTGASTSVVAEPEPAPAPERPKGLSALFRLRN
ncbi:MAG: mechanosensitive ion channel family protein [Nannocystaceae bacterium]